MLLGPLIVFAIAAAGAAADPQPKYRPLPSLREQDALERSWVKARHAFVPSVLKKHGYDAWILSMREYGEDPAFRAVVPTTTIFSSRRRTTLLFHTNDSLPNPITWIDNTPGVWSHLNSTLYALDPARIAINVDQHVAFADGLSSGERDALHANLDAKYAARLEPSREIPVEVVAARVGGAPQLAEYRRLQENVWAMISEGFSAHVVRVGETTPADLEWWFRDQMQKLGVTTWFQPSVSIIRKDGTGSVVEEGDVLHVDIGITAMGMNTDTQHLGYVLRGNETAPPAGLVQGLHNANRLQDFVREEMVPGRTGDEVFFATKKRVADAGLNGTIYSHPIGDYGHSAGAIIGMSDIQGAVPHLGSNKVLENYWTSVELAGETYVPEWGRVVKFPLEEDVYWNAETRTFEFVFGQQTEFHLVQPARGGLGYLAAKLGVTALWSQAK